MTTSTELARISKATEVARLQLQGMSVTEACETVGISRSTYYSWQRSSPQFIEDLREISLEEERAQLAEMLEARALILHRILEVVPNARRIEELVILDKHLKEMSDEIKLKLDFYENKKASEIILGGPKVRVETSRTGNRQDVHISIDDADFIDGQLQDLGEVDT